ncbi:actin, cytoplasmic 1-like [Amphiura filiformis]|uniref:actin, cytoplasmic 1-like n=1 Tax=Amphiura filiformis TaxID=82378 RepID=UPI003B21FA38
MATAFPVDMIEYKELTFHEKIGQGAFGAVNRVSFSTPFNGYHQAAAKSLFNLEDKEMKIMSRLSHKHIIKLIGFSESGPIHVILMEYASRGSLHDYLSDSSKPLMHELKQKWAKESALAIQYLHDQNYLHRDIKPSNCLLFKDNLLKLCDFGLARKIEHSESTSSQKGTIRYMAPELHVGNDQGRAVFSKPADIYAYGMMILEICTRKEPFSTLEWHRVVFEVGNGAKPTVPSYCSKDLADIMQKCWNYNPRNRPTIASIVTVLNKEGNKEVNIISDNDGQGLAKDNGSGFAGADNPSAAAVFPSVVEKTHYRTSEDTNDPLADSGMSSLDQKVKTMSMKKESPLDIGVGKKAFNFDDASAVVLDIGSGMVKAGFAEDDIPSVVFPTVIGAPLQRDAGLRSNYFGNQALSNKDNLNITYPIKHGIVTNWDDMERICYHTFHDELRIAPEEHAVLLTYPPLHPKAENEKLAQIMFETFNTPAMCTANQGTLALYASGRSTGVVVSCGDGVTHIVPIYDGQIVNPYKSNRINVAGRDLTDYLASTLTAHRSYFTGKFNNETVRDMKEKLCFVSMDFDKDMKTALSSATHNKSYTLPSGEVITIGNERFRCPEALFQLSMLPNFNADSDVGIHTMTNDSIKKCDREFRNDLYSNIVLSGGSTMFPGFADRMHKEMVAQSQTYNRIKVIAMAERNYTTWIGGSILGSLSTFQSHCISKQEYDENGPGIVHKKCFEG